MIWMDVLASAIEVAIAIAGFAGIVTRLASRSRRGIRPDDRMRFNMLLTASAAALVMCFAPFLVRDAGLAEETMWRFGSALQGLWFCCVPLFRLRQIRTMGLSTTPIGRGQVLGVVGLAVTAAVANVFWLGQAWPYLLVVCLQLIIAFSAFAQLARGLLETSENQP